MTYGKNSSNGVTRPGSGWCCSTTKVAGSYLDFSYRPNDILLFGREFAGVPDEVATAADARVVIPIKPGLRSLDVAMAVAMALGEALRQTELPEAGGTGSEET